ncbi:MAG: amidohydrolase family protein, partial [Anaeromusa sp.]
GEQEKGSLKAGKLADLIMVSQDVFQVPVDELPKTKVLLTMVGGQVRYKNKD